MRGSARASAELGADYANFICVALKSQVDTRQRRLYGNELNGWLAPICEDGRLLLPLVESLSPIASRSLARSGIANIEWGEKRVRSARARGFELCQDGGRARSFIARAAAASSFRATRAPKHLDRSTCACPRIPSASTATATMTTTTSGRVRHHEFVQQQQQ